MRRTEKRDKLADPADRSGEKGGSVHSREDIAARQAKREKEGRDIEGLRDGQARIVPV